MDIQSEIYLITYYVVLQFKQIFIYWISGVFVGSLLSVFAKDKIVVMVSKLNKDGFNILSMFMAALLGVISPICMYGTIPIVAGLGKKGVPSYLLVTFMVSSILLNPNLFVLSFALGTIVAVGRLFFSLLAGMTAGILVKYFSKNSAFLDFSGFEENKCKKQESHTLKRFFSDLNRAITKTAPYFLVGILLTALFERYFPKNIIAYAFGRNSGFGILLASSLGVPLYICGGGTIPLIKSWMEAGMSTSSVIAFMITGPATKLTNLGALKIILGMRNFTLYIVYILIFSIAAGLSVELVSFLFKVFI